jgi:hypothetical protein
MVIKKTFLPLRHIFDKNILAHEIIDWARCTKQKIIFLKLDFAKAYDKVSWKRLGMANEFIYTIKLFFQDAESSIYLNGNMTPCFQIKRRLGTGVH